MTVHNRPNNTKVLAFITFSETMNDPTAATIDTSMMVGDDVHLINVLSCLLLCLLL